MSADIQKEAVFDDRIVQSRPRYAVEKGALSLTNAPFQAIASTASQMTFNIYVPSENVFVDRALRWSAEGRFQMSVDLTQSNTAVSPTLPAWTTSPANFSNPTACKPVVIPGQDFSLCPFPLNALCQTLTATINDTTTVINSQDVLYEVMRLTDYKVNKKQRVSPTSMEKYQANYLGSPPNNAINSPLNGYGEAMNIDEVPNGSWGGFYFTDTTGSRLVGTGYYVDTNSVNQFYVNGVPVVSATTNVGTGGTAQTNVTLYWSVLSTELLTLSPFVFANDCEHDTGLFGINNIQLIMNFKNGQPLTRILKTLGWVAGQPAISNIQFNTSQSTAVWANPYINVQFLTPSLDVPLPPKSVVPYMEYPRFITQPQNGTLTAGQSVQIQSQTITLPQIPDLLIIYVKPTQVAGQPNPQDPSYGECYLPIASQYNTAGQTRNPLSINFDNFSGLLSSHTTEELYSMSVENGLDMDWNTWSGQARSASLVTGNTGANKWTSAVGNNYADVAYPTYQPGSVRPTTGGFLVLKPSKDITLQSGQAPSLVGNFTLQFNLSVFNTFPFSVQAQLFVITANSGFFESIRGSSRIVKGVLSEQDIISAPVSSAQTHEGLKRLVGGRVSMGAMANVLHRAKETYDRTKPMLGEDGHGQLKPAVMGGPGHGRRVGGVGTGAGKGISARLM